MYKMVNADRLCFVKTSFSWGFNIAEMGEDVKLLRSDAPKARDQDVILN